MTPNFATKGHQKHRLKKYKVFRNYNANLVIIFELTKFLAPFLKIILSLSLECYFHLDIEVMRHSKFL